MIQKMTFFRMKGIKVYHKVTGKEYEIDRLVPQPHGTDVYLVGIREPFSENRFDGFSNETMKDAFSEWYS